MSQVHLSEPKNLTICWNCWVPMFRSFRFSWISEFRNIRSEWISDFRFIRFQCIEYEWLWIYQPIRNLQTNRIWHGSEYYYLVSLRWACIVGVLANCIKSYFKCYILLPCARICRSSCYYKCKKEWLQDISIDSPTKY